MESSSTTSTAMPTVELKQPLSSMGTGASSLGGASSATSGISSTRTSAYTSGLSSSTFGTGTSTLGSTGYSSASSLGSHGPGPDNCPICEEERSRVLSSRPPERGFGRSSYVTGGGYGESFADKGYGRSSYVTGGGYGESFADKGYGRSSYVTGGGYSDVSPDPRYPRSEVFHTAPVRESYTTSIPSWRESQSRSGFLPMGERESEYRHFARAKDYQPSFARWEPGYRGSVYGGEEMVGPTSYRESFYPREAHYREKEQFGYQPREYYTSSYPESTSTYRQSVGYPMGATMGGAMGSSFMGRGMMEPRIWLVAVDDSIHSDYAVNQTIRMMDPTKDQVVLLNIQKVRGLGADDTFPAESRRIGEDILRKYIPRLEMAGIKYSAYTRASRNVTNEILTQANVVRPDFIVLGRRPASPFKSLFTASVSEYIAKHSSCPVIIAREPTTAV